MFRKFSTDFRSVLSGAGQPDYVWMLLQEKQPSHIARLFRHIQLKLTIIPACFAPPVIWETCLNAALNQIVSFLYTNNHIQPVIESKLV